MIDLTQKIRVAVCIATYKRPIGLRRLLNSLCNLAFTKTVEPDWHVIVVDNDQEGSALSVIKEISPSFPVPIEYSIEPIKGIASARNKAVKLAEGVDFVAFIDDDEVAESDWLDELLFVQNTYNADVVSGPVEYLFEQDPAKWIPQGKFFSRKKRSTGTKLRYSATNNILIRNKWLHVFDGPFDIRFNLTGGSDTMFATKVYQLGALGVWADDAVVYEFVPPERANASWILRRRFRSGITLSMAEVYSQCSFFTKFIRFMKGLANIIIGVLILFPLSLFYGYAGFIKSLGRTIFGLGEILGLFGVLYYEYK